MSHDGIHTVKSFEHELDRVRTAMTRMGRIVKTQVAQAVVAVIEQDEAAAQTVPAQDSEVDLLERDVETLAIRLLALRSPMAGDLREIVAALKITGDLERIGDYATSIARRSQKFDLGDRSISLSGLKSMGRLVQKNLERVIEALTEHDADQATDVWHSDSEVDEYYTAMFRELVTYMMEDPQNITPCAHLLFIAKNFERIGDHTTNIAERVYYAVTGDNLPAERPRGGRSKTASAAPSLR